MKAIKQNKNSQKIIAIALALVILATMFVGCNNSKDEDTTTTTTTTITSQSEEGATLDVSQDESTDSTTLTDDEDNSSTTTTTKKNTSSSGKETTTKKNTSTGSSNKVTTTNNNSANCTHSWGDWYYEQINEMYGAKRVHICKKCGKKEYASEHKHTMSEWYAGSLFSDERYCVDCEEYYETREADNRDKFMGTKSEYLELLGYINEARREAGLNELIYISEWQQGADIRAKEITEKFSHTRPDGSRNGTAYEYSNLCYTIYGPSGENIAKGYGGPKSVFEGWMNSSGHRNTILFDSENLVGFVASKCGSCWVMQTIYDYTPYL